MPQHLVSKPTGTVLADDVRRAEGFGARIKGLLGAASLPDGSALLLRTHQVHTFGMRFPIDVVFVDRSMTIVHLIAPLRPNRLSRFVFRARLAIELPAGRAAGLNVGDVLYLDPNGW